MKRVNKILSLVICLALCLGLLPAAALAEENSGDFSAADEESVFIQDENIAEEAQEEISGAAEENTVTSEAADAAGTDGTEQQATVETEVTVCADPGTEEDNDELFAGYVDQVFFDTAGGSNGMMLMSTERAGDQLSGQDKALYDSLKTQIEQVAAGKATSTVFTVPVSSLMSQYIYTSDDFGEEITSDNRQSLYLSLYTFTIKSVINSLLSDCSYECYWYSKTLGMSYTFPSYGYNINTDNPEKSYIRVNKNAVLTFYFAVSSEYAGTATYTRSSGVTIFVETDLSKTSAAPWAAARAKQIVLDASDKTDYGKLLYYCEQICSLTSYNSAAAAGSVSYGDPWQLIYVFDGDESTNVVCEGYAKAFNYLCEMTQFDDPEIYSITVTGTMQSDYGGGSHMWNVVHMPDGNNYLVDITNCDTGTIGRIGDMFYLLLRGYSTGTVSGGYCVNVTASKSINYYYSSTDTIGVYPDSWLALCTNSFYSNSVTEKEHTWSDWTVDLSAGTRTRACTTCNKTESCVIGDADKDGTTDTKDLLEIKRYLSGAAPTAVYTNSADLDGDGEITLKELLILKRQLAGVSE